jgi:hypothetical protein
MTISILDDCRTQTAVLFTAGVRDRFNDFTYSLTETKVRWEDKSKQFTDGNGEQLVSKSIVRVSESQAISVGDYLYLGTITSLGGATDPKQINGAFEIKIISRVPSLFGDQTSVKVIM